MKKIKDLTNRMSELDTLINKCTRCGTCQAVCPVFRQTRLEKDVARGKIKLLEGLTLEMFNNPDGVLERLNKCLLCGSCSFNCASGVDVLEIFIKSRSIIKSYNGLSWTRKIILRNILGKPSRFDFIIRMMARFQTLFIKSVDKEKGAEISCGRFTTPLIKTRHFKRLSDIPFHKRNYKSNILGQRSGKKNKPRYRAAMFTGCLIDKVFPDIAEAAVDVLTYHGIDVFIPETQGCCGIPALSSGDSETFNNLVQYNLESFGSDFDYIFTSCATCTFTIKKLWPMMFQANMEDDSLRTKVIKLAEKAIDINRFLTSKVGLERKAGFTDIKNHIPIAYHDPCHLRKSLNIINEPRELIKANPDYMIVEMENPEKCCGLGGSFNLEYYDISSEIGMTKAEAIIQTECEVVATGCPACMIQLTDLLSKAGSNIRIKHPVEIYRDYING